MWNHESVWGAIDALAARHGLSASGLAKQAGLDPTAFNPSKRHGHDGRPRWPSTESIAKVLAATGESLEGFVGLTRRGGAPQEIPISGTCRAMPCRCSAWRRPAPAASSTMAAFPPGMAGTRSPFRRFPTIPSTPSTVSGDSMLPLYRDGDVIIVSPAAQIHRGDRVVVRTADGEVMAKTLIRRSAKELELGSFNPDHKPRTVALPRCGLGGAHPVGEPVAPPTPAK